MNLLFLGDTNVGKTQIIKYLNESQIYIDSGITLGIKIYTFDFKGIELNILDTGEYYRLGNTVDKFLEYIDAIIVVYDIHSKDSFRYSAKLLVKYRDIGKCPVYLLGNKIDRLYGTEWKSADTFRVSGKSGENIKETFEKIVRETQKKSSKTFFGHSENSSDCCCFF
jgi:small GTP-binding protein